MISSAECQVDIFETAPEACKTATADFYCCLGCNDPDFYFQVLVGDGIDEIDYRIDCATKVKFCSSNTHKFSPLFPQLLTRAAAMQCQPAVIHLLTKSFRIVMHTWDLLLLLLSLVDSLY